MSPRPKQLIMPPSHTKTTGTKRLPSRQSSTTFSEPPRLSPGPSTQPSSEVQFSLPPQMEHGHQDEDLPWAGDLSPSFMVNDGISYGTMPLDSYTMGSTFMMPAMTLTSYDPTVNPYPLLNQGAMSQTLTGPLQDPTFDQEMMQASPSHMGYPEYQYFPQATIRHGLPSPPAECFNEPLDDLTLDPVCDLPFSTLPGSAMDSSVSFDKASSTSASKQNQPRPIRSASERSISGQQTMAPQDVQYLRDERADKVKARNDPRYDQKPDDAGYYHCPLSGEEACNHKPTKQKCIYAKYLDSHLKPYNCKHGGPGNECENLRFSSNACLFRHEREAHGMHNHGMNPYLCLYPGCERARAENGFPRRWNQRDHMKRVHDWIETDADEKYGATEPTKRRKQSGSSNGVQMKRSTSSQAKAQAAVYNHGSSRNVSMSRHQAQINEQLQECNVIGLSLSESGVPYPPFQPPRQQLPLSRRTSSPYANPYAPY